MRTYHFKDTLSKFLAEHIEIAEKREESIIEGLEELVLVTDRDLKILSANEAATRTLEIKGQIVGQKFLEVVKLEDAKASIATEDSLSIDGILKTKEAHIIKDLFLRTNLARPTQVIVQIKPVANQKGEVNQIVFVITFAKLFQKERHQDLELARLRHNAIIQRLKDVSSNLQVKGQIELLGKIAQDLLIAQELEDHPIKKNINFSDVALLCQQAINSRQPLAQALGVGLQFVLPKGDIKEQLSLKLAKDPALNKNLALSDFAIPTDPKWLELLLEKLIDISLFLSTGIPAARLEISLGRLGDHLTITILGFSPNLTEGEINQIFEQYYGNLAAKTNLQLGSGLEGFIAKQIADELDINIKQQIKGNQHLFQINFTKNPVT